MLRIIYIEFTSKLLISSGLGTPASQKDLIISFKTLNYFTIRQFGDSPGTVGTHAVVVILTANPMLFNGFDKLVGDGISAHQVTQFSGHSDLVHREGSLACESWSEGMWHSSLHQMQCHLSPNL